MIFSDLLPSPDIWLRAGSISWHLGGFYPEWSAENEAESFTADGGQTIEAPAQFRLSISFKLADLPDIERYDTGTMSPIPGARAVLQWMDRRGDLEFSFRGRLFFIAVVPATDWTREAGGGHIPVEISFSSRLTYPSLEEVISLWA